MEDGEVMLTQVGQAALESLTSLHVGKNEIFVMLELKLGLTPLRDKVKDTLRKLASGSLICFFGDMADELDGHMHVQSKFHEFELHGRTCGHYVDPVNP